MSSRLLLIVVLFGYTLAGCFSACSDPEPAKEPPKRDYIKRIAGANDSIPVAAAQRGEVLIAYADCYTCHALEHRAKGPAFKDIAARYPVNKGYISLLAQRIILGGSGAWGNPVMTPHPALSKADAELMVSYILSLK
ncbi:c-type cytochrome [Flavihumibacter sp. CACIAM 22H1]|uniref:c-type cytochrome n=1 Tax=Flavihumibacter sp. CACIAM 22H1 TaxID=1812911 RepID=UPI0025BC4B1B|nr:c-type cytochrome [Flavihumibacter sp. CACIAM 22H1]